MGIEGKKASNLWRRILVITDDILDLQTTKLIQLHSLVHIGRNRLFQQLWSSLQSLFAFPQGQSPVTQLAQIARLIFDSFRQPLPAGMRASQASARQLVYEYGNIVVDVLVHPLGSGGIVLVGQVLNPAEPEEKNDEIPVILISRSRTVMSTLTNRFGEFNLEFEFVESAHLEIRVGERSWVSTPSIDMAWAKNRAMELETQD